MNAIPKLVLTGGPCSGKTASATQFLKQALKERYGITALFVPEVASLYLANGVDIALVSKDPAAYYRMQKTFLETQLRLRELYAQMLELMPGHKKALFFDRAEIDMAGYISKEEYDRMASELGYSRTDLRDCMCDAVFHMLTAADGAEEFYELNNPARWEKTYEQARESDRNSLREWLGHEHLYIIDNSDIVPGDREGSLARKHERLLTAILHALGIPRRLEIERKYLVAHREVNLALPVPSSESYIEQFYLTKVPGEPSRRIRARDNIFTYCEKKKVAGDNVVREENEMLISVEEFGELLAEQDPATEPVCKYRSHFVYNNQYFSLDQLVHPIALWLLEIELLDPKQPVELPPFLEIVDEVTDTPGYSNRSIARGKCPA